MRRSRWQWPRDGHAHPVLAAWFDQLGRETPDPIHSVRSARALVRNAVTAAWRQPAV